MKITEEQVDQFQKDGAILLENAFSKDWIEKIKTGIEKNMTSPSIYHEVLRVKKNQGAYFNDYCNWREIKEFRDFVFNSEAGEIAAKLMRSPYAVFYHEHVLNKEPGTEKGTPWHQDQAYYPVDGWNLLSLWLPVDPVPRESTLRFVAGSHKGGWFVPKKFATELNYPAEGDNEKDADKMEQPDRVYQDVPDIDAGDYEILEWSCQPGDVVVFHGKTLHGAVGNSSSSLNRRVLSTRWAGEGTVLASRPWKVSPPELGGLSVGDTFHSDTFPLVYGAIH